jgi:hypothetical protein
MRIKGLAAVAARWSAPTSGSRRRGVKSERRFLQLMLIIGGGLFIASALTANTGSALLSLFACMACGTRIERNYLRGHYGCPPPETIE